MFCQPLEFYISRGKSNLPETILLGHTPEQDAVHLHAEKDIFNHILFRGQTNSGKTFALALFLMELLSLGHRAIFIDPLGSAYDLLEQWIGYLLRDSYMKGEKAFQWFQTTIMNKIIFLDLSKKDHPFRHNILLPSPSAHEDISDVIARILKLFNCLYGGESGDAMDQQLQRRTNMVNLCVIFAATNTPLQEALEFIYNKEFRQSRLKQAKEKSSVFEVQKAVKHWNYLEESFSLPKFSEHINSLETALSIWFENPSVRKFLMSGENNIGDPFDILNNKILFVKTPVCDLPTRKLLLQYFWTLFLDLSDKRSSDASPVFFGSDESALCMNSMMSDYICRIRNHKVYLLNSHQSLGQMLSEDGIRIAKTIESQSAIKFLFRHDMEESEQIVRQIFSPQGKRPKMVEITTALTRTASQGTSISISESFSQESSVGLGQSLGEQFSETSTKSFALTDSYGITNSLSNMWSQTRSLTDTTTIAINQAFTYSENLSKGIQHIEGKNIAFTLAEGKSLLRLDLENSSVTIGKSKSQAETTSQSDSISEGTGETESVSSTDGMGISMHTGSGGKIITVVEGSPVATGGGASGSKTLSQFTNYSKGKAHQRNQTFAKMDGLAKSLSVAMSEAKTKGYSRGNNYGISEQKSLAMGNSFSEAVSMATGYARGIQEALGHSKSFATGTAYQRAFTDSTGVQISRAIQQAESLAFSTAKNWGMNLSKGRSSGETKSQQISDTLSAGVSISLTWRIAFYTLEEEYTLLAQELKDLPKRTFFLSIDGKRPIKVFTKNVFFLPYMFGEYNFLEILRKYYLDIAKKTIELPASPETPKSQQILTNLSDNEFEGFFPVE